jgi:hypothetical protein
MDNQKDGIRKYSDLILWYEIIDYCSQKEKNVIFVTDDVKADWWNNIATEGDTTKREFHDQLISEFEKKSGKKIIAVTSNDFYTIVSSEYYIEISNAVNMALIQTTDSYIDSIQYKAFEKIQDEIIYSQEEYIDKSTSNIGSEGLSELEIESYDLIRSELVERNDNEIIYSLIYSLSLSATSCEYWGRDEDTKEVITSPDNSHIFEGELEIRVLRVLDDFVDLLYENDFENVEIISCKLGETEFKSGLDDDYEEADNYCPKCGNPMPFNNDALNGFCIDCTRKYNI